MKEQEQVVIANHYYTPYQWTIIDRDDCYIAVDAIDLLLSSGLHDDTRTRKWLCRDKVLTQLSSGITPVRVTALVETKYITPQIDALLRCVFADMAGEA